MMARIQPFKGIYYNQKQSGPLADVITPPYDVLSIEEQESLYSKSPFNLVRLEQGLSYADDHEYNNRYTRAAKTFQQWIDERVLIQDDHPSFYLHEQSFKYRGSLYTRIGMMAALRLEPFGKSVFPHERTMTAPKEDRYKLLKHLMANISPIFMLMRDPDKQILSFYKQYHSKEPSIEISETNGHQHRIWKIKNQKEQQFFSNYAEEQKLLIADGHHRYETALKFSTQEDNSLNLESSSVLVTLVSSEDSGLLMLPTHRLLNNLDRKQQMLINDLIDQNFEIHNQGKLKNIDLVKYYDRLSTEKDYRDSFGYLTRNTGFILVPKVRTDSYLLPVEQLHKYVLEPFMNVHNATMAATKISYPHELEQIARQVYENKSGEIAFIFADIRIDTVWDRALKKGVMPQKTTFFYPKLPGGLILRSLKHC